MALGNGALQQMAAIVAWRAANERTDPCPRRAQPRIGADKEWDAQECSPGGELGRSASALHFSHRREHDHVQLPASGVDIVWRHTGTSWQLRSARVTL